MRQILTVFGFTFKDAVRKKAFIISTIIILVLTVVGCMVPKLISAFTDGNQDDGGKQNICYYIDESNLIPGGHEILAKAIPGTDFVKSGQGKEADFRKEIKDNADQHMVIIDQDKTVPQITVVSRDFMSAMDSGQISDLLSKQYGAAQLKAKNISPQDVALAQIQLPVKGEMAGDMNVSVYAISIALTLLMFFAIYYYGYGVAMSIATEKTSRVMETLVVSAKPSKILMGKCLAMGAVGLLQFVVILCFGGICYTLLVPEGTSIMGAILDLSSINVMALVSILVYFILGYALYAVMNSVCGALVSKIEDLNSAMMPVTIIALGSFYLGYVSAAMSADNLISKIAMYVPFSSPFIMPFKLLNSQVTAGEAAISMILLIAAIAIITMISIKLYSASVLHYGKPQKLKILYKTKVQ